MTPAIAAGLAKDAGHSVWIAGKLYDSVALADIGLLLALAVGDGAEECRNVRGVGGGADSATGYTSSVLTNFTLRT